MKRPLDCPHQKCLFIMQTQEALCAGKLLEPVPHDGDVNTHRICFLGLDCPSSDISVVDLQVNTGDLYHLRRILNSIDGRGIGNKEE